MKFVVLVVLPILALCWREVGHMLTAAIAEIRINQINPEAGQHFFSLINSINDLCDNRTRTFVESACWPDDLKQTRNFTLFDGWHFINPPYLTDTVGPIINQTANAINVIATLNATKKVLSLNLEKHTAERALFARYLVHLTGDIHQPLHACSLFNRTFPSGDLGGNLINITLENGQKKNLHHFWDTGAYFLQNSTWHLIRPMNQQNRTYLYQLANKLIGKYGCSVEGLAKSIDPVVWSNQSFAISKNTTYPFVLEHSVITKKYRDLAYETSIKRITLAGYRLANYVSDLYKSIAPPRDFVSKCQKRKPEQISQDSESNSKGRHNSKRTEGRKLRKIEQGL